MVKLEGLMCNLLHISGCCISLTSLMEFKEKVIELRNRLPIGISDASTFLNKNNGDIKKAEYDYKEKLISTLIKRANISREKSENLLADCNYDIEATLKVVYNQTTTLTEKILDRNVSNEEKVYLLCGNLENKYGSVKQLVDEDASVNDIVQSFIVVTNWLDYCDYEGYDYAISLEYTQQALTAIEIVFKMPLLTKSIQRSINIKDELKRNLDPTPGDIEEFCEFMNTLTVDADFSANEAYFVNEVPQLYENMISCVRQNMELFPK